MINIVAIFDINQNNWQCVGHQSSPFKMEFPKNKVWYIQRVSPTGYKKIYLMEFSLPFFSHFFLTFLVYSVVEIMPTRKSARLQLIDPNKNKKNSNDDSDNSNNNNNNTKKTNTTRRNRRRKNKSKDITIPSKYLDTKPDIVQAKFGDEYGWIKGGLKKLNLDKFTQWIGNIIENNTLYWLIIWKKGLKNNYKNMISPYKSNQFGKPVTTALAEMVNNWGAKYNVYELYNKIT